MTAPITLPNTLEMLEAEYFMGIGAEVQNLPRLAVLHDEIERLKADKRDAALRIEMGMTE